MALTLTRKGYNVVIFFNQLTKAPTSMISSSTGVEQSMVKAKLIGLAFVVLFWGIKLC